MRLTEWKTLLQANLLQDFTPDTQKNTQFNMPIYIDFKHDELKPAAVLVPLVWRHGDLNVIMTMRTAHLTNHAGQIAFPGGRMDKEDVDLKYTALREADEEIGLNGEYVKILGAGDTYQTNTGFLVKPVIGLVAPEAPLQKNDYEVEEIFEIPLSFLLDRNNHREEFFERSGMRRSYFVIEYDRHYVWGVTAAIIRMLSLRILGEVK
jgi:8-oxo-dGTP pyrophosphatase MutT (NUDIX family)